MLGIAVGTHRRLAHPEGREVRRGAIAPAPAPAGPVHQVAAAGGAVPRSVGFEEERGQVPRWRCVGARHRPRGRCLTRQRCRAQGGEADPGPGRRPVCRTTGLAGVGSPARGARVRLGGERARVAGRPARGRLRLLLARNGRVPGLPVRGSRPRGGLDRGALQGLRGRGVSAH